METCCQWTARYAWDNCQIPNCKKLTGSISLQEWIRSHILLFYSQDGIRSHRIQALVATLWDIWVTSNKRIFQEENGYLRCYFRHIRESFLVLHDFSKPDTRPQDPVSATDLSCVPPPSFLQASLRRLEYALFNDSLPLSTIRVDGSWHKQSKHYGIGWSIELQNMVEKEVGGRSRIASSALLTEFWACLYALRWALDNGYRSIKVLTYSALLVTALRKRRPSDIQLLWTLKEIVKGNAFQHSIILKVDRTQVALPRRIANQC
uniref:RNase H type-1 domain-containing protein n=1 Tax=Chenopodium quinoa TaxID=63459 RepID=A0A803MR70_CHEQI